MNLRVPSYERSTIREIARIEYLVLRSLKNSRTTSTGISHHCRGAWGRSSPGVWPIWPLFVFLMGNGMRCPLVRQRVFGGSARTPPSDGRMERDGGLGEGSLSADRTR